MSSLEKCLFSSLAHFLIRILLLNQWDLVLNSGVLSVRIKLNYQIYSWSLESWNIGY